MARRGWHHFGWSGAEALSVSMRDITGSVWAHDGGLWMPAWRLHLPRWCHQATASVSGWVKDEVSLRKRNPALWEEKTGREASQKVFMVIEARVELGLLCVGLWIGKTLSHSKESLKVACRNLWSIIRITQNSAWGGLPGGSVAKNHLLMQETWIQPPTWKDPTCWGATKPLCHNYWACALEPGSRNNWTFVLPPLRSLCPRAHALQ